jgi:hypothetical protein
MKTQMKPQTKSQLYVVGALFLAIAVSCLSIADMSWGQVLPMLVLLAGAAALVIYAWNADGPNGSSGSGDREGTRRRTTDWD